MNVKIYLKLLCFCLIYEIILNGEKLYLIWLNYVVYFCDVFVCCVIKLVCNIWGNKYGFYIIFWKIFKFVMIICDESELIYFMFFWVI